MKRKAKPKQAYDKNQTIQTVGLKTRKTLAAFDRGIGCLKKESNLTYAHRFLYISVDTWYLWVILMSWNLNGAVTSENGGAPMLNLKNPPSISMLPCASWKSGWSLQHESWQPIHVECVFHIFRRYYLLSIYTNVFVWVLTFVFIVRCLNSLLTCFLSTEHFTNTIHLPCWIRSSIVFKKCNDRNVTGTTLYLLPLSSSENNV